MSPARLSATFVVVGVLVTAGACSGDDDATPPSSTLAATTSTADGPAAAGPTTTEQPAPLEQQTPVEWSSPGSDLDNSRTAIGSPIDTGTVSGLTVGWDVALDAAGQLPTVPLVADGIVYVQGTAGAIAAIELVGGDPQWVSESTGFNIGPVGAAVGDDLVFGVHGSSGVVAVDRTTGEEIWVRELSATPTTGIDIQPLVHDGVVYASTVPVSISGIYTPGDRGVIHALDAATGDDLWTFDTVEGPVDGPDALWGNAEVNSGGGAWYPPAIDEERGLVYWGIANPAPFPGTADFPNGSSRPGPNLYTDSLVALDIDTGALRWFHQVVPHDLLDRDQVHALIARLPDGADVVVSAGKSGILVGLDPDSGEVLWETSVGVHRNDDLAELTGPTEIWPGSFGGVITPPATADGIVYAAVLNSPTTMSPDATSYFGSELGTMDSDMVAVDAADGAVLWTTPLGGDSFGAAAVVNDLVLTTRLDGTLLALDRGTGEIVHEVALEGSTNGWLSVVGETVLVPMNSPTPRLVALTLG